MQTTTTAAPAAVTTSHEKVGAGTTARHTPGPWYVDGATIYKDIGDERYGIVDLYDWDEDDPFNGALIAAAPDLLEACRELLSILPEDLIPEFERAVVSNARAAIAKAEGRP